MKDKDKDKRLWVAEQRVGIQRLELRRLKNLNNDLKRELSHLKTKYNELMERYIEERKNDTHIKGT